MYRRDGRREERRERERGRARERNDGREEGSIKVVWWARKVEATEERSSAKLA